MQSIRDAATLLLLLMLAASIKITPLSEVDVDWTAAQAADTGAASQAASALPAVGPVGVTPAEAQPSPKIEIRRLPCNGHVEQAPDQDATRWIVIDVEVEAEPKPEDVVVTPCPKGGLIEQVWTFDSHS